MTPERWKQIADVYHEALEVELSRRSAFLDQACANDEDIRAEVTSLLASRDKANTFLDSYPNDVIAGMIVAEDRARSMTGRTLGRYELHFLIGSGGMGEVYSASDTRLEREVAVKILPAHLSTDHESLRRFEREAQAVAALSHPNILSIYDFGSEQDVSYAVMELLQGETVRERLQNGPIGWKSAAEIGVAICEGLSAAHARGIIHRDLKPENIFLTSEGQVKILDFGIARLKRTITEGTEGASPEARGRTNPSGVMGTIGYMSPEQVRGETVDAPSDIFSFGCVLFEMASGVRAFAGESQSGTVAAILSEEPVRISELSKEIPAEFEKVARHCLEKRPEDRYQSAREVATDLRALASRNGSSTATHRSKSASMRVLLACVILIGLIAVWAYLGKSNQSKPIEALPEFKSIAVLPFKSLTPDASSEYLGLGLADTVITKLSSLESMIVRPTSAILKYSSPTQDPLEAGREQQVGLVLDPTLQRLGERLRVSVRLLNVSDGRTVWTYQCEEVYCDNIFAMQDVIAERLAAAFKTTLTGDERRRLRKRFTENREAYDAYSEGLYFLSKITKEDTHRAIAAFRKALNLDPNYALAHAGLSDSYSTLAKYLWCSATKDCMSEAKAAALRAIAIDGELGQARACFAECLYMFDWDWTAADKEFRNALELNPGYGYAHVWYGLYLARLGRFADAKPELERALEIDPLSLGHNLALYELAFYSRDYAECIAILKRLSARHSDWADLHRRFADVYERKGMFDDSFAERLEWNRLLPQPPVFIEKLKTAYATAGLRGYLQKQYNLMEGDFSPKEDASRVQRLAMHSRAAAYARIGENEGAIYWLQQAYEDRDTSMVTLKVNPVFDGVRSDPRFMVLLQKVGLTP